MTAIMRMSPLEMAQVWGELTLAHCGRNRFGGDVAEIYAYRFGQWGVARPGHRDLVAAAEAMHDLLATFAAHFECSIYIEGRPLGPWLRKLPFQHRVHVQVVPGFDDDGPVTRSPIPADPSSLVAHIE